MEDDKVSTIPLIAHENHINRLYKVIRWLIVAIILISFAFTAYVCVDRYLDTTADNGFSVEQNSSDNGRNSCAGGDYNVSESNNKN